MLPQQREIIKCGSFHNVKLLFPSPATKTDYFLQVWLICESPDLALTPLIHRTNPVSGKHLPVALASCAKYKIDLFHLKVCTSLSKNVLSDTFFLKSTSTVCLLSSFMLNPTACRSHFPYCVIWGINSVIVPLKMSLHFWFLIFLVLFDDFWWKKREKADLLPLFSNGNFLWSCEGINAWHKKINRVKFIRY